jgi:chromosome segregation ATPase
MNTDILDLALGNAEKLYTALRAFRDLCRDISDFEEEAKRVKADAAQAKRELGKLNAEVSAAQATLDKAQLEREKTEQRVRELAAEHAQMMADINRIREMVAA